MSRASELRALGGCVAVGALVTAGPWLALGMPLDKIILVSGVQIACLWAAWGVALSRRFPWLSRPWSPFAVGVAGGLAGLVLGAVVWTLARRSDPDEPFSKALAGGLVGVFWFGGWFATLAVGFLGGCTLGAVLRERKPS